LKTGCAFFFFSVCNIWRHLLTFGTECGCRQRTVALDRSRISHCRKPCLRAQLRS